jgi:hypothetical protein
MPSPAPSPFAWPVLLGAASFFVPAVAARAAGRSLRRDPAGQVAGVLLLVGVVGLAGLGQALGVVPRPVPVSAISSSVAAVLMLAPLLGWIGGAAPRWRGRAQAAVAGALVVAALFLGVGREFRLVTGPLISLWLTALSAAALARTVRAGRASGAVPGDRPTPILGALFTYYLTAMVSRPLVETLVGTDPRAVVDAHMGLQLVYAGCMAVVAWGVARRPAPVPTPARGPEPRRAPADTLPPPVVAPPDAYPAPQRPAQRQAV